MTDKHHEPHAPGFKQQVEEARRLMNKRRVVLRALAAGEVSEEELAVWVGENARAT